MQRDLAFGTAALALSIGYYWMARLIPESQLADSIGPQGLPTTYAILLGALALILIVRSLTVTVRQKLDTAVGIKADTETSRARRATGTLIIGILYIVVVPWLGYLLSLAGLIFATTRYQGGAVNRQAAIVAVSGAVFCWVLFVLLMRIAQPPGLWPSLL
ncbi:MAG TPA: tripartite tricarboxylate transporter TctB family protein [Vicinamibacterales bacterium]|nr:tripartite tricarboxylate transporter TctB family protein [Vicinamibacterales bacterium]